VSIIVTFRLELPTAAEAGTPKKEKIKSTDITKGTYGFFSFVIIIPHPD
jgi:hypothetical protein